MDTANEVEQDPIRTAKSTRGTPVGVPLCAVSISRAFRFRAASSPTDALSNIRIDSGQKPAKKKRKQDSVSLQKIDESVQSDGENSSDLDYMLSDHERSLPSSKGKEKEKGLVVL